MSDTMEEDAIVSRTAARQLRATVREAPAGAAGGGGIVMGAVSNSVAPQRDADTEARGEAVQSDHSGTRPDPMASRHDAPVQHAPPRTRPEAVAAHDDVSPGTRDAVGSGQAAGGLHLTAEPVAIEGSEAPITAAEPEPTTLPATAASQPAEDSVPAWAPPPDEAEQAPPPPAATLQVAAAAAREDEGVPLVIGVSDTGGAARIVISGLPDGAVLSAGETQADGSWSLTPEELEGLRLLPAAHWSGEVRLDVRLLTAQGEARSALDVTVTGVADLPQLRAGDVRGEEDAAVALDLSAALVDRDGSEALTLVLLGLPPGATLSAGMRQADGNWLLDAAALGTLSLTPPRDFAGTLDLTLRATSRETNGDTAVRDAPFAVVVAPVADAARVVAAGSGAEDGWIAIRGALAATDADGSETLGPILTVSGVPAGALLSHGGAVAPGVWEVPRAVFEAGDLAIRPPGDSDAEIALRIAVATEDGATRATTALDLTVAVAAVADAPVLRVADAIGAEDEPIALDLAAMPADRDGSESLAVTLLGVPDGARLSAGTRAADGSWRLAPAELAGLSITPPPDFSGRIALVLRAVATEAANGDAAARELPFVVEVAPRADAALLEAGGNGGEDRWITVAARFATPDTDGSESLAASVQIAGVPAGALLNRGTETAPGVWSVATADLLAGRVALRPPADRDADITLTLTATLEDRAGAALHQRSLVATAEIRVAAVADAPVAFAHDVAGSEDTAIALDLGARLGDRDGSETLTVAILGLPADAALSAGARAPDGSWQVAASALTGLRLTPPPDFAGTLHLALRATATEADGGDSATVLHHFSVAVAAVVDGGTLAATAAGREDSAIPILAALGTLTDASEAWAGTAVIRGVPAGAVVQGGTPLGGGAWQVATSALAAGQVAIVPPENSDAPIALTIETRILDSDGDGASRIVSTDVTVAVAAVADAPLASAAAAAGDEDMAVALDLAAALADGDGSEALTLTILGLPAGATLSAGARQADGSWNLVANDLHGLTMTPPRDFADSIPLVLRATSTEAANGAAATVERGFTVSVAPRADRAQLSASGTGSEDGWVPIRGVAATTDSDGSEALGAMLSVGDVPAGAVLSHGTETAPGSWSVPLAVFLAGDLAIKPPANSDADITLRLGVTAQDGSDSRETAGTFIFVVRAVADAPTVQVADAHGSEDSAIRLAGLGGALMDTDGSETLRFLIGGLPVGARLTAGTRQGDGSWLLTPAQLAGVSLTPPSNFSGTLTLTLTARATEARDGALPASSTASFRVTVDPVVDAGAIAGTVTGDEDAFILVRPSFTTPDTDGSESWSATSQVSGVPAGASLTRGGEVSPGVWEVATADLRAGLVSIRPPPNSDADFDLTITATLIDVGNGHTASRTVTGTHRVAVRAVADVPVLHAGDAAGAEDQPVALDLAAHLADIDGSEQLAVVILGVPAGAALTHGTRNADGSWSVAQADLAGLALTPPRDFSGSIALTLRATATDNDASSATTSATFTVQVNAVADAPELRVGPAAGNEDTPVALRISGATTDSDGSERLLGFRLLDVPAGATVRAGGTELSRATDGSFFVDAAAAPSLAVAPPPHSDQDFTLRVVAIAEEPNGSRAESAPRDLPVRIAAIADAPVWLRIGAAGSEDTVIPLDLAAQLPDADGSERLSYVVSGLPAGAVLNVGTYRGPGSWSLTAAEAATASITPPADFAGTITLTVSAVAQEIDGGSQAVSTVSFPVHVAGVVDTADWSRGASGAEDAPIALNLMPPLRDADGSERAVGTAVIQGVPPGAVLRLGDGTVVAQAGGAWHVAVERLAGVTLTMPPDSDETAVLTVTVTVEDGGVQRQVRGTVSADASGVADRPVLAVEDAAAASAEWAALRIVAASSDPDGSESVHVWVRDLPAGFTLSAGVPAGDGAWLLDASELRGLEFRSPAGFEGEVTLRVQAVSVEREGDTERTATELRLAVNAGAGAGGGGVEGGGGGVADAPELKAAAAAGVEDRALALSITVGAGAETVGIVVSGVPAGARLTSGIHDPERSVWVLRADQLDGLHLVPPQDFGGEVRLHLTAVATGDDGRTASAEQDLPLWFEPVADGGRISASPGAAREDVAIPLNLGIAAADSDGSETATAITLSGLSPGARIAAAAGIADNGDGSWSVAPSAAGAVRLLPPENAHGSFGLTVTVTTREAANGATATVSRGIGVTVAPFPDAPAVAASDVVGVEDQAIPLALSASLVDRDGSEAMSVVLTGFPTGARLSAGINNGDGSWTLTPAQLTGLTVTPPHDWSGRMALTMRAHAMERSTGEVATTEVGFAVVVAGAADAPLVDAPAALRGAEDQPIALDLIAALTDRDGSESLVIVVTGVPVGGSFSSGAMNPDGSWTIPGAALPGLAFTPPVNYAGTLRLDVAAMSLEADGDSAETRFSIAVTVDPVADAPVVALAAVTGDEDRALALNLAATLTDTDGSESIARYLVSGLPAGATLSAGTRDGDVWTLTPAQAVSVTMMPPPHWSGSVSLSVTAVSREAANGDEASTSTALSVTILPVADAPVLAASPVSGSEDQPIALHLAATLADTDGSESIARYLVSGLPAGASLSAGTEEAGIWTLTPAQAAGVAFIPPPNWAGSVSLSVTAVAREAASGAEASTTTTLPVTVQRVADAPILAAAAATGSEDASVALGLSAVLADTDGSESFAAITVSGLPAGFGLSAGTALGGGTWALQPAQLAGLRLTLPPDWNGSLSLTFGARAQDGASTANTSRVFDVTVAAVNDAPVLSLAQPGGAAVGQEQAAAIGEATIADVDDARMASATISLAGAVAGDRLVVTGHALQDLGDTTLIGTTGIALARTADGGVTLSGAASRATYGAVLASLALENTAGLSAGTRSIGVTLYDEAGAAAATQLVTLTVEPSLITGTGDAAELSGTTGHDTFLGSFGDETMRGAAGADLFVVGPGGGLDLVDGGAEADTLRISGAGAPGEGGWTLIVDGAVQPVEYSDRYDFAQPVSGHVQFADGTQVELLQIERITW